MNKVCVSILYKIEIDAGLSANALFGRAAPRAERMREKGSETGKAASNGRRCVGTLAIDLL